MKLRRMAAGLLAGALAALTLAAPARATELTAGCNTGGHRLSAWAYYSPGGAFNYWTEFRYMLWGSSTGGESNVNLRVNEWYYFFDEELNYHTVTTNRYIYYSPDTLDNDVLYTHVPPGPIATQTSRSEYTRFVGIFDTPLGDPQCPAETVWI